MTKHKTSLTEEDYLGIIDLHKHFVECRTRADLNDCFERNLLPLLACESILFGWGNEALAAKCELACEVIQGFVGITKECAERIRKSVPYTVSMSKKLFTGSRSVVACDVDVSRKATRKELAPYYRDHPEDPLPPPTAMMRDSDGRLMLTFMVAIDRTETSFLGIGVHRWAPNDRPFTLRDVRVVELVRPILFQTIRTIVLSEELAKHKSLAESLADIPIGVALVRHDMRVIFLNRAFKSLLPLEPGHKLPANLETAVKREVGRIANIKELPDTLPDQPFYKILNGTFRLSIDPVNKDGRCYLLRLKPANDAFSQLNMKMQTGDLSNREKEICCLAKDGFTNEQIAERLFLSRHTVKTHMKHINKKLDVHSRSKLVALLNRKD